MKNYVQDGVRAVVTAPEAADSGEFLKVGEIYGVAEYAAVSAASVVLVRRGVFTLPKVTGAAWAQGDKLFWDSSAKKFTLDASKTPVSAVAFSAADSGDTEGEVLIGDGDALKAAYGQHTTVTASDTVVTGLAKVVAIVATLDSDPVDDPMLVSASIGDQAGAPAAGSVLIKTWKNTGGTDPTPAAAATFAKKVNWVAYGY